MKLLNHYNVDIFNLREGQHEYEFEAGNSFFEYFENEVVKKGSLRIKAVLTKGSSVLSFEISTQGQVTLVCDRSLKEFDYPLSLDHRLIFRFGEEDKELDDDLFQITNATHRVNLAKSIYENLLVSLPMKKVHPDLLEDEDEDDEFDLVYTTGEFEEEEPEEDSKNQSTEEQIDPRWAALKKLKNKEE
jgi:uncharacterized protein